MVSEFLTEAQGRLHYLDKVSGTKIEAYELLKYGKNDEGWWDSDSMLSQVLTKAVPIFEKAFPGHIGVFAFDNSNGHACKALNALTAIRINMGPGGGKQPKMHSTITPQNILRHIVYRDGDSDWKTNYSVAPDLKGMPKGLKRVLREQGLWREGLRKQCNSRKNENRKTTLEANFLNEKSLLEIEIAKRGH
ncbi:hypothetical protein HOY82DRAFT_605592 [Tuber indicum]|nr:hypothetical protein HOY82DRAFT_605592 [Tuber indicum]